MLLRQSAGQDFLADHLEQRIFIAHTLPPRLHICERLMRSAVVVRAAV
jgi:hypothetical protein